MSCYTQQAWRIGFQGAHVDGALDARNLESCMIMPEIVHAWSSYAKLMDDDVSNALHRSDLIRLSRILTDVLRVSTPSDSIMYTE